MPEELITKWLDERSVVDLIYLDFSKALDSVNHRFLLNKLRGYGIAPIVIGWVEFFLRQRTFQVNVNGTLPLYKAFIHPHLEYAVQAPSPILSLDYQTLESIQKLALNFVKGLRHVPYETALQWLPRFSIVRRRIRVGLICTYKMIHGLLDFPCDSVLLLPPNWAARSYFQNSPTAV